MSDFLASFGSRLNGKHLLEFLRSLYPGSHKAGNSFDSSWGAFAALDEPYSPAKSIRLNDGRIFCWVGDLNRTEDNRHIDSLVRALSSDAKDEWTNAAASTNGAFAICSVGKLGLRVVTDVGGFTPVYIAKDASGKILSLGTHADLVAVAAFGIPQIDHVSLAHFLDYGYSALPRSLHVGVEVLSHASVHAVELCDNQAVCIQSTSYWSPPKMLPENHPEGALVNELRQIVTESIRDRAVGEKIAVCLSGGLDSRLILAVLASQPGCAAVTFHDDLNRETRTAREVAASLKCPWIGMKRGPEYLSSQLEPVVDAVGCEGEWVTAHEIGFVEKFEREGYSSIVHGLMFDSFLKCRNAKDLVKHKRFGGLLSPRYELKSYDLASAANHGLTFPFVEPGLREQVIRQRRSWMLQFFDQSQYSHVDVLATFPHLRRVHANWCAERRFLPIRMPALDKRVIEFFHRCPVLPRLGGRLLEKAAYDLLGPCKQIPNANTGVRIGSGRFSALTQRSFRLIKERSAEVLKVGVGNPKIEHSWHDYPRYWRTSAALKEIRQRFEHHLENLYPDFLVFPPRAILDDKRLHWSSGFRLLQVAAWMDRVPRYAEILVRITRSEDRAI